MEIEYYSNALDINKSVISKNIENYRKYYWKNSDKKIKSMFSINNRIISDSQVIAE